MQSFKENFEPVHRFYNRWLNGFYTADLLQFKGGSTVGTDYISRVFQSRTHQIEQRYSSALESTRNPSLVTMLTDNWQRFAIFNALQRLIVAYQAYPSIIHRFGYPGTFSHTFTEIMNEGVFRGALKGVTISLLQFSTIMFPAVYIASKSNNDQKFGRFALSYTLFDSILYPLDTIKSVLYADTIKKLSIGSFVQTVKFKHLYNGYVWKMIYNVPLLSGIYCTTQTGKEKEAAFSWLAALILYPINTAKVMHQVGVSSISYLNNKITMRQRYRGAIPFILLNVFMGWQLRPLFSAQKLEEIKAEVAHQKKQYFGKA